MRGLPSNLHANVIHREGSSRIGNCAAPPPSHRVGAHARLFFFFLFFASLQDIERVRFFFGVCSWLCSRDRCLVACMRRRCGRMQGVCAVQDLLSRLAVSTSHLLLSFFLFLFFFPLLSNLPFNPPLHYLLRSFSLLPAASDPHEQTFGLHARNWAHKQIDPERLSPWGKAPVPARYGAQQRTLPSLASLFQLFSSCAQYTYTNLLFFFWHTRKRRKSAASPGVRCRKFGSLP